MHHTDRMMVYRNKYKKKIGAANKQINKTN